MRTTPGERVMIPDFGINLNKYLFEPLDNTLIENLKNEISVQFRRYIPNAELLNLKVTKFPESVDASESSLYISVIVTDKKTNEVIPLEIVL